MSGKRVTIRFTDSEWEALDRKAGSRPVSTWAREQLLGSDAMPRKSGRRPRADQVLLAKILAALGQSELPQSMRELADAAQSGTVPRTGDVLLNIRAACLAIEKMRCDLTEALGIKPE